MFSVTMQLHVREFEVDEKFGGLDGRCDVSINQLFSLNVES